jgi:endosialidase-like protein
VPVRQYYSIRAVFSIISLANSENPQFPQIEIAHKTPVKIKLIAYSPELLSAALSVASLIFVSSAAAQNVGIGVPNPQSKLSLNGTTSSGGLAIGDSTYTSTPGTVAPTNGALIEGFTGIGLTAPQVPLHINGEVFVSPGGVTGVFWDGIANMNGVDLEPYGTIGVQRSDGANLHLSKPAGSTQLDLVHFVNGNGGTPFLAGTIVMNNDLSSVSYNTTSDERLKENIRPTAKGLNEIMRIQVSDYNFKSKPGNKETGFIAQQLYTIFPDAVTVGGENAAEKPWSVDYGRVTPLLTKSIQDLDKIAKEQQTEIDVLKEQNRKQVSRLAALEAENAELQVANKRLAEMSSEMEALKKVVATMQEKENDGVRTAALIQ